MNSVELQRATSRDERVGATRRRAGSLARRLIAILAVSFAVMAVSMSSGSASAAPGDQRTPARAGEVGILEIVPGTHRCENFGSTVSGYRAGHCADLDIFVNSSGYFAFRGQGQTFCQRASDGVVVQCAGIGQRVTVRNLSTGETSTPVNSHCGRRTEPAHNPACPSGRFQKLGSGIYAYCGDFYDVIVRSTVDLPVSGSTQRSQDFVSYSAQFVC